MICLLLSMFASVFQSGEYPELLARSLQLETSQWGLSSRLSTLFSEQERQLGAQCKLATAVAAAAASCRRSGLLMVNRKMCLVTFLNDLILALWKNL